jgi:hypothetical protein
MRCAYFPTKSVDPVAWRTVAFCCTLVFAAFPARGDDAPARASADVPAAPSQPPARSLADPIELASAAPTTLNGPASTPQSVETIASSTDTFALSTVTRSPAPDGDAAAPLATDNAMVNLINLLVAQHVITPVAGSKLISQATQEAAQVHQQLLVRNATPAPPPAPTSDFAPDVASLASKPPLRPPRRMKCRSSTCPMW